MCSRARSRPRSGSGRAQRGDGVKRRERFFAVRRRDGSLWSGSGFEFYGPALFRIREIADAHRSIAAAEFDGVEVVTVLRAEPRPRAGRERRRKE